MGKIKVVMLEPETAAYETEIEHSLRGMQKVVGGYIETVTYPFHDNACIICNEEDKILGLPQNRVIEEFDGLTPVVADVICGTAFICGIHGDEFCSLTDEQIEEYKELFHSPIFEENGVAE